MEREFLLCGLRGGGVQDRKRGNNLNYYMTCPMSGQEEQISCCDWLPEWARWSYLARLGYGLCPGSTQIMLWCLIPYDKSFIIDQACSVKMAGYWPRSFFVCLWTLILSWSINTQKKELGQYSGILTSCLVNNPYL